MFEYSTFRKKLNYTATFMRPSRSMPADTVSLLGVCNWIPLDLIHSASEPLDSTIWCSIWQSIYSFLDTLTYAARFETPRASMTLDSTIWCPIWQGIYSFLDTLARFVNLPIDLESIATMITRSLRVNVIRFTTIALELLCWILTL